MSSDSIATNASNFTITSSNSSVLASNELAIATTGDNKGKLVSTAAIQGAGATTVTVTVNATGKSTSFVLDAKAARATTSLSKPEGVVTNLISGASTSYNYEFVDQYGKEFTNLTANDADLKVNLSLTKVSGDDNG